MRRQVRSRGVLFLQPPLILRNHRSSHEFDVNKVVRYPFNKFWNEGLLLSRLGDAFFRLPHLAIETSVFIGVFLMSGLG